MVAISKSRTEEARDVERARIILACLEGKEIQQVAQELGVSVPTVSKWRKRFLRNAWPDSRKHRDAGIQPAFPPMLFSG